MIVKNISGGEVYLGIFQPHTPPNALNSRIQDGQIVDLVVDGNASPYDIFSNENLFQLVEEGSLVLIVNTQELSQEASKAFLKGHYSDLLDGLYINTAQFGTAMNALGLVYVYHGADDNAANGKALSPYSDIQEAVDNAEDGDTIHLKGDFTVSEVISLPSDKSLSFTSEQGSKVGYAIFDASNGEVFKQSSISCTKDFKFNHIHVQNAGGYGIYIRSSNSTSVTGSCEFTNNGWSGSGLSTVLADDGTTLGYDSSESDLQAFWAGPETSNGGAMRIRSTKYVDIVGNKIHHNLRGLRIQDCGEGGRGVITRNEVFNNIESGIYLASGSYTASNGCQNFSVYNNGAKFNANNGILCIGGLNNLVALNQVEGNWNAGIMAWHASNLRFRDMDLNNNNRSSLNGIGNTGDAHSSISVAGNTLHPDADFIVDVFATEVYNTGLGSNTERVGVRVSDEVSDIDDRDRCVINLDAGLHNQDVGVHLQCDLDKVRLSNSCRYMDTAVTNLRVENGCYYELPYGSRHTNASTLDLSLDETGSQIAVKESSTGEVIDYYGVNQLKAIAFGTSIRIILKGTSKIQFDDIPVSGCTIGGTLVNGVLATAVNELNGLFTNTTGFATGGGNPVASGLVSGGNLLLTLADSSSVTIDISSLQVDTNNHVLSGEVSGNYLVLTMSDASTISIDIATLSPGSNPVYPGDSWYAAFGVQAGNPLPSNNIYNNWKDDQPFYHGQVLSKGGEFIFPVQLNALHVVGIWSGLSNVAMEMGAMNDVNWDLSIVFDSVNAGVSNRIRPSIAGGESLSQNTIGFDIDSRHPTGYPTTASTVLTIRYQQNDKLGVYDVTGGGNILIMESLSTFSGPITFHGAGQGGPSIQTKFEDFVKRTDLWTIVHDYDNSEGGEWRNGVEQRTICKSNLSFGPGQKLIVPLLLGGGNNHFSLEYNGPATGETNPVALMAKEFRYDPFENLHQFGSDWVLNENAAGYTGSGWQIASGTPAGIIEFRYKEDNKLTLWSVSLQEKIAQLTLPLDGTDASLFFGRNQYSTDASGFPELSVQDMEPATTSWDEAPDVADQEFTVMAGNNINWTPALNGSDLVTMYAFEGVPAWMLGNQETGQVLGTAPTHSTGVEGDDPDVYTFTLKAGNPFGISTCVITVNVAVNTSETPWTRAVNFDGGNEWLQHADSSYVNSPFNRASNGDGSAWTATMVFQYNTEDTGYVFATCEGPLNTGNGIRLVISASTGLITFRYGTWDNSNRININLGNLSMTEGDWYSLTITYDGGTTGTDSSEEALYMSRFKFYTTEFSTATVTETTPSSAGTDMSGNGFSGSFGVGDESRLNIGSNYGNNFCKIMKMAYFGVTNSALSVTDIAVFSIDPITWKAASSGITPQGTKLYLMGDGSTDSYPNIVNEVDNTDLDSRMIMMNMVSTDIVTVNIPDLS